MIIAKPNDGLDLLYHLVDLHGKTVHAYRDLTAALRRREGDQRLFVQEEDTGVWLTGVPHPDGEGHAQTPVVSSATVDNLRTLRAACVNRDVALAASSLLRTGEPVAILCAIEKDGESRLVKPFGMLHGAAHDLITHEGRLSEAAEAAFDKLVKAMCSERHQAWFGSDALGRPTVTMLELGETPKVGCKPDAVLVWDDPYTLFAPLLLDRRTPAGSGGGE